MFISLLLLLSISLLSNPSGSLHKASDILPNISPKTVIAIDFKSRLNQVEIPIDFKSRLNQAEKELQNSKAVILKEVGITEKDFNDFIKATSNFYNKYFSQEIAKFKKENRFCKLTNFSKEISAELQKNPEIEIFVVDNLESKYGSHGISMGQAIFVDSKFVDNQGIIMHEICHSINHDLITLNAINTFIKMHNKITYNFKSERFEDLKKEFKHNTEKKADLWSAAHCKDCAKQLVDLFKSPGCRSTECHPDDAARIAYLS